MAPALDGRAGETAGTPPQGTAEAASVQQGLRDGPAVVLTAPVAPTAIIPPAAEPVALPVPPGAAAGHRPDPTALLPPSAPDFRPPDDRWPPQTPGGRAQTAILDPPPEAWQRPFPAPSDPAASGRHKTISVPIVLLTAAVVIAAGAAALLLRDRKPARSPEVGSPALAPRGPATGGHSSTTPLAEPFPAPPAQPAAASSRWGQPAANDRAPVEQDAPAAGRARPKQRPARRW